MARTRLFFALTAFSFLLTFFAANIYARGSVLALGKSAPGANVAKNPAAVQTQTSRVLGVNTATDWPMAAADPTRSSHNGVEVPGSLSVEWFRNISPYIDPKTQVIAANNQLFVTTSKGLYSFNAATGAQLWVFGTEMPLSNSPTYFNGTVYVGGMDHRLYAVNAADGTPKAGYTAPEAGAGFETSPLVVSDSFTANSPVVFLGNRDGYFYAIDANTGAVKWKFQTGGPVRFSAAYKNGVIYFGADDNVAYALNASGTLKWKTPSPGSTGALPGVGFSTYWPVIYTNPADGKDYVLFTGSKKSVWGWLHDSNGNVNYNYETYQDPANMFVGNNGCSAVSGQTFDCSIISNYFANKSEHRNLFVLDAATGVEKNTPYAPVNWSGVTRGGNKYPPLIGSDNRIYTHIGFNNAGSNSTTGIQGWIAGWNFGTTQIFKIYNPMSGAGDEPEAHTSGGNLIYYGESFNADSSGSMNITQPIGTNTLHWTPEVPGIKKFYSNDYQYNAIFGGSNGVLGILDGMLNQSPIPYNGKLYIIYFNTLIALSSTTASPRDAGDVGAISNPPSQPISLTTTDLQNKLGTEVQKMITAGHLRPGFMDSGILAGAMGDTCDGPCVDGNYLNQYFTSPADTLATLSLAMPYLSAPMQTQLKNYLISEEANYPVETYISIGWKYGAKREIYDDTSEMQKAFGFGSDLFNSEVATIPRDYYRYVAISYAPRLRIITPNVSTVLMPEAFYGAWKYATAVGLTSGPTGTAATLFNSMKAKLPKAGLNNDMTDANLILNPYLLNEYINGYRGYVELDKLANNLTGINQSSQYGEYQRLVNLRLDNFSEAFVPIAGQAFDYRHTINVAKNFMYMTPELADIFRTSNCPHTSATSCQSVISTAVSNAQRLEPYWEVAKFDRTFAEAVFQPLYDRPAIFQAMAYIQRAPLTTLVKYLDVPAFDKGDLFYIQNLTAALNVAGGGTCTPNCTGKVCGPDGCGGNCGPCQVGYTCSPNQDACLAPTPTPTPILTPTPLPTPGQGPYGGVPWTIPGTFQIEDYDLGGEGVGYHDVDAANLGGQYRTTEGVDIESTSDGSGSSFEVGWAAPGEWLKYTVNVATTGTYNLILRAQQTGSSSGGKIHLEVDGVNVTGSVALTSGVWNGWYTNVIPNISLSAGQHILRLVMDSSTNTYIGNLNWMHFDLASGGSTPPPVIVPTPGTSIFYVSPTGNDANPGTITLPWKTLAKAANTVTAGQTVYVRAGTYNERLKPVNSGTNGNYTIFSAYPGETVTIDGTALAIPKLEGLVDLNSKSFVRIANFRVVNAGAGVADGTWNMGISARNSDHIVIDHNKE